MGEIRIGISGWTYPPWRGRFYPKGWPQHRELEYAARQVSSIEINGSFYSLQRPESYRAWYEATPEGFVFSIKGSLSAKGAGWLVDAESASRPASCERVHILQQSDRRRQSFALDAASWRSLQSHRQIKRQPVLRNESSCPVTNMGYTNANLAWWKFGSFSRIGKCEL